MKKGNEDTKVNIQIEVSDQTDSTKLARKTKGWGHWNSYLKSDEYTKLVPGNVEITEEELATHNKPGDLWIGLMHEKRVCVFDITVFAEYHPGGYSILESVAGRDATEDFRLAHAYVNPSMISRFKKGYLVRTAFKSPNSLSPGMSILAPVRKPQPTRKPKWDWNQVNNNLVELRFNLHRVLPQFSDCISLIHVENENLLKLRIFFDVEYYFFEIKLHDYLTVLLDSLKCEKSGKSISISFSSRLGNPVSNLGGVIEDTIMSITDSVNKEEFIPCTLLKTRDLNHDCREFVIEWPDWTRIGIPLGHHVIVSAPIEDNIVQRPYTPVCEISPNFCSGQHKKTFSLMIKRYNNGLLSSYMHTLEEDSRILISVPTGKYQTPSWVKISPSIRSSDNTEIKSVVLVAAGSGITPMIRLILSCLSASDWSCHLIFFNRTERDMIYADEFESLARFFSERFKVSYVLSQHGPNWTGLRGRISISICKELLADNFSERFYLICGPLGFNKSAIETFRALNVSSDKIFEFAG